MKIQTDKITTIAVGIPPFNPTTVITVMPRIKTKNEIPKAKIRLRLKLFCFDSFDFLGIIPLSEASHFGHLFKFQLMSSKSPQEGHLISSLITLTPKLCFQICAQTIQNRFTF